MKRILFTLLIASLLTSAVFAGNNDLKKENDEIKNDLSFQKHTLTTSKKLDHLINLWHDACLKGNMSLIKQNQVLINNLLEENIKVGTIYIEQAEKELYLSKQKASKKKSSPSSQVGHRSDLFNDKADLKEVRNLLMAKKHLYQSMRRSDSFSNRYRLLGDYAEMLRREIDHNKIEIAEDIQER